MLDRSNSAGGTSLAKVLSPHVVRLERAAAEAVGAL